MDRMTGETTEWDCGQPWGKGDRLESCLIQVSGSAGFN